MDIHGHYMLKEKLISFEIMHTGEYKDIVYEIIGAAMTVHSELNWGLLEPLYNEALYMELIERGIESEREKTLSCYYKKKLMEKHYQMDMVVKDDIVVELKSVNELTSAHRAQLFNYMRLTRNANRTAHKLRTA